MQIAERFNNNRVTAERGCNLPDMVWDCLCTRSIDRLKFVTCIQHEIVGE